MTPARTLLTIAEEDLADPEALTLGELAGIAKDLAAVLADEDADHDLRIRATKAAGTVVVAITDRFRIVRGALVAALFAAGMSYPVIGERFGVTGERARQWAMDAPKTTDNRSTP